MSISVSIFSPLEIEIEFPSNGNSLTLREVGGKTTITIYGDVHQWWALRSAFPKARDYYYATDNARMHGSDPEAEADAIAHYEANKHEPA